MIVKVCGMRDAANIAAVEEAGADWIGMIFHPQSPRNVSLTPALAATLPDTAPMPTEGRRAKRVGVFVDPTAQQVITMAVTLKLDMVQFHGHETPTLMRNLRRTLDAGVCPGVKFIKAISVAVPEDIDTWSEYADVADLLLFDTKCQTAGGSGRQFDWSVLSRYKGNLPFLLSGGIGPDDAQRVAAVNHPQLLGVDINSRFETSPGMKDVELVRRFIKQIKS